MPRASDPFPIILIYPQVLTIVSDMAAKNPKRADRRVLRTRKAIMDAFDQLLSDKNRDKITVSAIAREAGIDRKTFYLHYKSVDDLANHKAEEALEQILAVFKAEGLGKSFPERIHIILSEVNKILAENVAVYSNVARRVTADRALEYIEQAAKPALKNSGFNPDVMDAPQSHMRLRFFIAGTISLYSTWLKSDHSQPIETVSNAIEEAIWSGRPRE